MGHDWSFKFEWLEANVDTNCTAYSSFPINLTTISENVSALDNCP